MTAISTNIDILILVFAKCDITSLINCELVCTAWLAIIRKETMHIWKKVVESLFPPRCAPLLCSSETWRDVALIYHAWSLPLALVEDCILHNRSFGKEEGSFDSFESVTDRLSQNRKKDLIHVFPAHRSPPCVRSFPDGRVLYWRYAPPKNAYIVNVFDPNYASQTFHAPAVSTSLFGIRSPFYFTDTPSSNSWSPVQRQKLNHIDSREGLAEVEIMQMARTQFCGSTCFTHSLDAFGQGRLPRPTDILHILYDGPRDQLADPTAPVTIITRTPFKAKTNASERLEVVGNNETIVLGVHEDVVLIAFRLDDQVELSRMALPVGTLDIVLGRTHVFMRNRGAIVVASLSPLRALYIIPISTNGSIRLADDASMIFCWTAHVSNDVEPHLIDPRRGIISNFALPAGKLARYRAIGSRSELRGARSVRVPTNGEFFAVMREYPVNSTGKRTGGPSEVKVYWRDYGPPVVPGILEDN